MEIRPLDLASSISIGRLLSSSSCVGTLRMNLGQFPALFQSCGLEIVELLLQPRQNPALVIVPRSEIMVIKVFIHSPIDQFVTVTESG